MLQYTKIKVLKKKSTELQWLGNGNDDGRAKGSLFTPGQVPGAILDALANLVKHAVYYMEYPDDFQDKVVVTGVNFTYRDDVRLVMLICTRKLTNGHTDCFNSPVIPEDSENPDVITMTDEYVKDIQSLIKAANDFRNSPTAQFGPLFGGQSEAPAKEEAEEPEVEVEISEDGSVSGKASSNGEAEKEVSETSVDDFLNAEETG